MSGSDWLANRIALHRVNKLPFNSIKQNYLDKRLLPKDRRPLLVKIENGNPKNIISFFNKWNMMINITRHPLDVLVNIFLDNQIRSLKLSKIFNSTPNHPIAAAYISSKDFKEKIKLSFLMSKIEKVKTYNYETISRDSSLFLNRILEDVGVDHLIDDRTLMNHYPSNLIYPPVKSGLKRESSELWKKIITPEQAETLIRHIGFDLKSFGYESSLDYSLTRDEGDKNYIILLTNETVLNFENFLNLYINQNQTCNHNIATDVFKIKTKFTELIAMLPEEE